MHILKITGMTESDFKRLYMATIDCYTWKHEIFYSRYQKDRDISFTGIKGDRRANTLVITIHNPNSTE